MSTFVKKALAMPPVYPAICPVALVDVIKTAKLVPFNWFWYCSLFDNLHESCCDLNWIRNPMMYIYIYYEVKCEIDMKVNASKFWKQGNFASVENCNELTNISIRLHSVWKQTYSAHLAHLPDILVGLVSTLCWRKWTKRWGVDLHCMLTDWSKQSS